MKGTLGKVLKGLMDTWAERHSTIIGFFEVLCPWRPCLPICSKSKKEMSGEYHYYMAGRGLGFVALIFLLLGIAKFILEVLL